MRARGVGRSRVCAHISLGDDRDHSVPSVRVPSKPSTQSRAGICDFVRVCVCVCAHVQTCVKDPCVCECVCVCVRGVLNVCVLT